MALVLQAVAAIVTVLGTLTLYFGTDPSLLTLGNTVMLIGATFMAAGLVTFAVAVAVGRLGAVVRSLREVSAALDQMRMPPAAGAAVVHHAPSFEASSDAIGEPPAPAVAPPLVAAPTPPSGMAPAVLAGAAGGLLAGATAASLMPGLTASRDTAVATDDEPKSSAPAVEPVPHPVFGEPMPAPEPTPVETITAKDWSGDEDTLRHAVVEAPLEAGPVATVEPTDAPVAGPLDLEQELAAALGMTSLSAPPAPSAAATPAPEPEPEPEPAAAAEPDSAPEPIVLPKLDLAHPEPETVSEPANATDGEPSDALHRDLEDLLKTPIMPPPPPRASETDALDDDFLARLRDTAFRAPAIPAVAAVEPVIVEAPPPVAEDPAPAPMELDLEAALRAALAEPLPTLAGRAKDERASDLAASERAEAEQDAEKVLADEMADEPFADDPPPPPPAPTVPEAEAEHHAAPEPKSEPAGLEKLARDFPELGDLLAPAPRRTADEALSEPFAAQPEPELQPVAAPPIAAPLLREGVIAGMPFRLYGDGTIEADLPAGATRFASLKDFRAHVGG